MGTVGLNLLFHFLFCTHMGLMEDQWSSLVNNFWQDLRIDSPIFRLRLNNRILKTHGGPLDYMSAFKWTLSKLQPYVSRQCHVFIAELPFHLTQLHSKWCSYKTEHIAAHSSYFSQARSRPFPITPHPGIQYMHTHLLWQFLSLICCLQVVLLLWRKCIFPSSQSAIFHHWK